MEGSVLTAEGSITLEEKTILDFHVSHGDLKSRVLRFQFVDRIIRDFVSHDCRLDRLDIVEYRGIQSFVILRTDKLLTEGGKFIEGGRLELAAGGVRPDRFGAGGDEVVLDGHDAVVVDRALEHRVVEIAFGVRGGGSEEASDLFV